MKTRMVISYLLLAVYTIVLVHTCIPHDHHNHDVMSLMEGTDVCYMFQCQCQHQEDKEHHLHHHPVSHHEDCQHIDKFLRATDVRTFLDLLCQICTPAPVMLTIPVIAESQHFFCFLDHRVLSGPLVVHRALRAPPIL